MNNVNFYNYRYLYIMIVLFSSIYVMITSFHNNALMGDFYGLTLVDKKLYFICFIMFIALLFYYDIFFKFSSKLIKARDYSGIRNEAGWCVLFFQISYMAFNYIYDMNRAGDFTTTSNPLKYIFLLANADYIFLLYFCYSYSNETDVSNVTKFNLIVFLLSSISRGWFGFLPLLFVLIICKRIYIKRSISDLILLVLFSLLLFNLLPYLYIIRALIRAGQPDEELNLFNVVSFTNSDDSYFWLNSFIARFDSVPSLYYFFEKIWPVDSYSVQPLYMQGIFLSNIYKWLGFEGEPIARLIVKNWFGSFHSNYQDRNTAFTSTIIPYLSIDGLQTLFIFIYFHACVFFSVWISAFCNKNNGVLFLNWYMGFTIFLSGWAAAYLSFLISQMFFMAFFIIRYRTS